MANNAALKWGKKFIYPPEKVNTGTKERIISVISGVAVGVSAVRTFNKGGYALLLPSALLLWRGITGNSPMNNLLSRDSTEEVPPLKVSRTITILGDRAQIYAYWRNLENLPNFMKHIKKVNKLSEQRYAWEAEIQGETYRWNAEITEEVKNKLLAWRASQPTDIQHEGRVEFNDAPGGSGVELKVVMQYHAAKTAIGKKFLDMLNPVFEQKIREDIRKFKRMVEVGELPELHPQPQGS